MNVTIIGTGKMARALSTRFLEGGNHVTLVGHTPGKAHELVEELKNTVKGGSITAAKENTVPGEVVFLAVPYSANQEVAEKYRELLTGKVVVDITNPIKFQTIELAIPDSSSAEELAKSLSVTTRVVKAFTTTFSTPLTAGQAGGLPLDVFIAGDDAQAKLIVSKLVEAGGMQAVDTGPLARARQLESLQLLHIAMQAQRNTNFTDAFKIVA